MTKLSDLEHNAVHFWNASLEGVPALLSREDARELLEAGFIEDYTELPGRGRYAGRWQATWTDKLRNFVQELEK